MKNKYYLIILIIPVLAFIFSSCENIIEFDGEETKPLLVVNSFCTPDSLITVNVSKSKFFLEDNLTFDFVNNAEVYLWVNGAKKEKLSSIGNGNYQGTYKPLSGDKIKITAKNAEFSEVEGMVEIPQSVMIQSVDTTMKISESRPIFSYTYDQHGNYKEDTTGIAHNTQVNFEVSFDDPAGLNYYRLVVKQRQYFADSSYYDYQFYINSDDLVFGSGEQGGFFDEGGFSYYREFTDELFNGKKYKLKFYANFWQQEIFDIDEKPKVDKPNGGNPERTELIIELQNISKSYYMYIKTLVGNSSVDGFFSEPVQIQSNVVGGIGIIGGYTHSVYKMEFPMVQGYYSYSGM